MPNNFLMLSILSASESYYRENKTFANNLDSLSLTLPKDMYSNYNIELRLKNADYLIVIATAKKTNLTSYVGALYFDVRSDYPYRDLQCKAEKPNTPIKETILNSEGDLKCPEGFVQY